MMSYFTDITKETPTDTTSSSYATSYLTNTCGDLLESTGFFRVESYANTSASSNLTNACIVISHDNKIRIRLYATSSSTTSSISLRLENAETGTIVSTSHGAFSSTTSTQQSKYYFITTLRILHVKGGLMLFSTLNTIPFLTIFSVKNIHTDISYYVYTLENINSSSLTVMVNDSSNLVYSASSVASHRDLLAQKQIVFPLLVTHSYNIIYMSNDHYVNGGGFMFEGFVEMNNNVYYCIKNFAFKVEER